MFLKQNQRKSYKFFRKIFDSVYFLKQKQRKSQLYGNKNFFPRYFLKQSAVDTLHLTIEKKNTLHLTMGGGGGGGGEVTRRIKVVRSRV